MDCLELLEGDVDTGYSTTQTQSITKSRMRSVADELELPPIPRDSNMFSGLRNQGATCYLNSLFQAFFMCPEIRQFFYELDLEASGYETDSDRYKILKQFQLLVGKLRFLEFKNHSTIDLTEAFGWNSGEGGEQQDVAEAMRIIFDTLERCFEPSGLADKFSKTFKGEMVSYITCLECGNRKERPEKFCDLILPIKSFTGGTFKSIQDSIDFLTTPETLDGNNLYACEVCDAMTMAVKGQSFGVFPDVLTLSLSRFDICYETFQRIKINDYYKYDLRLDFSKWSQDGPEYDLFAVLIHRGDAYGGHYHGIIRDTINERDLLRGVEEKDKEDAAADAHTKPADHHRKFFEAAENLPEDFADYIRDNMLLFDGKAIKAQETKTNSKDDCGDPFPTDVPRTPENEYLFNGWFDFDDTRISEFDANKLHKYFGKSKESAYILMYRKRDLHKQSEALKQQKPNEKLFDELINLNNKLKEEHVYYQRMKNTVQIRVGKASDIFDSTASGFRDSYDESKLKDIDFGLDSPLSLVKASVKETLQLSDEDFSLVMYELLENGSLSFPMILPEYTGLERWVTVRDAQISHKTCWAVLPTGDKLGYHMSDKVSLKNTQIYIKVKEGEKVTDMLVPKYMNNDELLLHLQPLVDFPLKIVDLNIMHFGEETPLIEIPLITRAQGIPYEHFEIVIKEKDISKLNEQVTIVEEGQTAFFEDEKTKSLIVSRIMPTGDESTIKMFVDYTMPLEELLFILKDKFDIHQNSSYRLRNLNNDHLYSKLELQKSFIDLGESEGGQRVKLESGKIPLTGEVSVKVKHDVYETTGEKLTITEDFMLYINNRLVDYFEQIEKTFHISMTEYTIYEANWNGEATAKIKNAGLKIEDLKFSNSTTLVLMHNTVGTSAEMRRFTVYFSKSGNPLDVKKIGDIDVHQNKGADFVIDQVFKLSSAVENLVEKTYTRDHLLVRELTSKEIPTRAINSFTRSLKKEKTKVTKLFFTIEEEPIQVSKDDLFIYIRERKTEEYDYGEWYSAKLTGARISMQELKEYIKRTFGTKDKALMLRYYKSSDLFWQNMPDDTDNIRKSPYFIKDGSVIGFLAYDEGTTPNDDMQTTAYHEFARAIRAANLENRTTRKEDDGKGFSIKANI